MRSRLAAVVVSPSPWPALASCGSYNLSRAFRAFSSKQPPGGKDPGQDHGNSTNKGGNNTNSKRRPSSARLSSKPQQRFKPTRKKEWTFKGTSGQNLSSAKGPSMLEGSKFTYRPRPVGASSDRERNQEELHEDETIESSSPRLILPSLNAAALLDPFNFCKSSALASSQSYGNHSISGTDAARRLLRGKKEFLLAARSFLPKQKQPSKMVSNPAILNGHGVPPQLFQHCIDMADALLLQYGHNVVECTFHNYHYYQRNMVGRNKLPHILRTRSRDATNRCSPWPPRDVIVKDWNYHLELYLTVMERMALNLGMVLQKKHTATYPPPKNSPRDYQRNDNADFDDDDLTSSPLLFPNVSTPQWNVDILRGFHFDIQPSGGPMLDGDDEIPPMPIVEFSRESDTTGHVVIRLQGYSASNTDFASLRSPEPVTLVFDACFRSENPQMLHK